MQNQAEESTYPWLKIWVKPRNSLHSLLTHHPKRFTLLFALLYGLISSIFWYRFLIVNYPTTPFLAYPLTFLLFPVGGLVLGFIYLYFSSWLYRLTGSWLGGKASYTDMKCAIGWSCYPFTITLLVSFLPFFFVATSPLVSFIFSFAYIVVAIWSIILWVKLLAEAHQFGFWKAVLAILIASALIYVVFILIFVLVPPLTPLFK